MPDLNSLLLEEYERKFELYRAFATKVETLLRDIVADKKLPVHSVSSRVKTRHSLEQKLKRPGSSYRALSDVTDLVGMRIICYFADDVDRIAALVEQQFQTDTVNTVDKRKILDPDRFGYLSLHHVVRFTPDRSALIDYSRFLDLRAEIQTRSILQHSWAEIEHDLGYKGSVEVPRHLRRRFSRVAGLLELADDEFRQIRDDLKDYQRSLPKTLHDEPSRVLLDLASISAFIEKEPLVRETDERISKATATPLDEFIDAQSGLERLELVGVINLAELQRKLSTHQDLVVRVADEIVARQLQTGGEGAFSRGISLFYLAYVLLLESKSDLEIKEFIQKTQIKYTVRKLRALYEAAQGGGSRRVVLRSGRSRR